jgi:hypothetical protein
MKIISETKDDPINKIFDETLLKLGWTPYDASISIRETFALRGVGCVVSMNAFSQDEERRGRGERQGKTDEGDER